MLSLIIKKILFGNSNNIEKRVYFWNLAANMLYSLQSAILLLIVTRAGGLSVAGLFSIIYTTTHMFASLGNYNMRNFQVSDAKNIYSYKTYFSSRIVSCILMAIACCIYGVISYDSISNICIVLLFTGYRITDSIEDVYHGYVQKVGRLDVASIARSLRIFIATVAFCVSYVINADLFIATIVLFLSSLLILIVCLMSMFVEYPELNVGFGIDKVIKLLVECMPLCISAFLYNYLVNAPKYAIDRNLSSETQAIFNILFMPIFVINVLSMFIFNPLVADMGKWWNDKELGKLRKSVFKQTIIILVMTISIAIAGYVIGWWMLGIVYNVDLADYKFLLFIMLFFGGIAALANFYSVVVTIMRKQYFIIVAYILASITSFLFIDKIVVKFDIDGAGYAYGFIMSIVLVILMIVTFVGLFFRKENREVS